MLDKWHANLLVNAKYDGKYEIPIIEKSNINIDEVTDIIPFSEILRTKNFSQWVCFYENDESFEKIWNRPIAYLDKLKKFKGVITPDFSVYQDMPLSQQIYNIYRQRVIGRWLQLNGINTIVNVRWGDYRTFKVSCSGVPQNSIISIGTLGCFRNHKETKESFYCGFNYIINKIKPVSVIIYGPAPNRLITILSHSNLNFRIISSFKWKNRKVKNG